MAAPRAPIWDFAVGPARAAPGVLSMIGYRALDVPDRVHRGLPSASLTLIVSGDDGVRAAPSTAALPAAAPLPVLLGGLHLHASRVRQCRGQTGVQLAVHPLASRALFGLPAGELGDVGYDATAVLGAACAELPGRVGDAGTWRAAFDAVSGWLTGQARDARVRPELAHAWRLLEHSRGRMPIGVLAERVALSRRHLGALFRREVGHGPKTVAMLLRFEHATTRIAAAARRGDRIDLAGIAAATGYSDQAHLSREFVRFAGLAPRAWLAEEFQNIQDGGHTRRPEWCDDHRESNAHPAPGHRQPDRLADPASP